MAPRPVWSESSDAVTFGAVVIDSIPMRLWGEVSVNLLDADDMGATNWTASAEQTPRQVALSVDDVQREPYVSVF